MISKIILGLFSIIILFQVNSVYGLEELPVITIEFTSGDTIDLDKSPQMIRAYIQIQNYNPQHGYHFMEISRLSDGEIIKTTEIFPKVVDDNLFDVQILHYLEPDNTETNIVGDYVMRIFSESGPTDAVSNILLSLNLLALQLKHQQTLRNQHQFARICNSCAELLPKYPTLQNSLRIPAFCISVIFLKWYADDSFSESDLPYWTCRIFNDSTDADVSSY